MPFPWRNRCRAADAEATLPAPSNATDVDSWRKVRFGYIRNLRKNTKCIILLMAMIEALNHGPLELAYRGRHGYPAPGPEDYGFAYNVAFLLSYIYVCVFMIVFVPLFSWWIPSSKSDDPSKPSITETVAKYLKKVNMMLLPVSIMACGVSYLISLVQVFIYVDARQVNSARTPKNSKKTWIVRGMLLTGIMAAFAFGFGTLQILATMELARVKTVEYYVILCPMQINLGLLLGTKMQMRMERRIAMKEARNLVVETEAVKVIDEKAPLVEV